MKQELKDLIRSYPSAYSDKEIVTVIFAETGEIVNENQVHLVRIGLVCGT